MSKTLSIHTDGGARGNPGAAGIGVVIADQAGKTVAELSEYIGTATNNQAEYHALIRALEAAQELAADSVRIFMDSELAVKQIQGAYKVKDAELAKRFVRVRNLLQSFRSYAIEHIPRAKNKRADLLVNKAIDAK